MVLWWYVIYFILRWLQNRRYFSISVHSQCSDQGYTAKVYVKTVTFIDVPVLLSINHDDFVLMLLY